MPLDIQMCKFSPVVGDINGITSVCHESDEELAQVSKESLGNSIGPTLNVLKAPILDLF